MKYWSVAWKVGVTGHDLIKAETKDEAKAASERQYFPTVENIDIDDAEEIVEVTELTQEEYDEYRK